MKHYIDFPFSKKKKEVLNKNFLNVAKNKTLAVAHTYTVYTVHCQTI